MLIESMLNPIEHIIQSALLHADINRTAFNKLEGCLIKLVIDLSSQAQNKSNESYLFISIKQQQIYLHSEKPSESVEEDIRLSGPLPAFITLALRKDMTKAAKLGFKISGNPEIAQSLQIIFFELQIDWESIIAQYSNDFIAHELSSTVSKIISYAHQVKSDFKARLKAHLFSEQGPLIHPQAINEQLSEIDDLHQDTERLALRIKRLQTSNIRPKK